MEIEQKLDFRQHEFRFRPVMSPEIVEISEESISISREGKDVYVAVGKDDLDALKWVLKNLVVPGTCVFLVHVFSPVTYIPTPVGKLSKSQVGPDQWKDFINQESHRRRNLLQKYVRLCSDSQVVGETILIESNLVGKAIVDLIPVLNISRLVMGTKRSSRLLKKGVGKSEFVRKNAPEFCEVTIICDGKNVSESQSQRVPVLVPSSPTPSAKSSKTRLPMARPPERNFFQCTCFTGKFS